MLQKTKQNNTRKQRTGRWTQVSSITDSPVAGFLSVRKRRSETARKWAKEHKDRVIQQRLKYQNSEKGKRTRKLYKQRTIKQRLDWQNNWKKRNPHKAKEYYEKYKKLFPEKLEKKNFQSKIALGRYKISFEEYQELKKKQNNLCLLCGKPNKSSRSLAIDHCHKTGRIRGLLCSKCNIGLGMFEDNIKLLKKAIIYLQN